MVQGVSKFSPLTDRVVRGTRGTNQQRSSPSLFLQEALIVSSSGMDRDAHCWCCPCSIFSAEQGLEVCAFAVSLSGDLSFSEESWGSRLCTCCVLAYDQCSSLHWAALWCVVCFSCHAAELRRSRGGASVWSVGSSMLPWTKDPMLYITIRSLLESILLLERGFGDDVQNKTLQKQAPVVIAVANFVST